MNQIVEFIMKSFQNSGKKHLIITGKIGSGKTTLFKKILMQLKIDNGIIPGITTYLIPKKCVMLRENETGLEEKIGEYCEKLQETQRPMRPLKEGFLNLGISALERAITSESIWISIDEIGFLESNEEEFKEMVRNVFYEKRVIAVLRKQDIAFLNELKERKDVFVVDLDTWNCKIGCIIMASGLSTRFGTNKLLKEFQGQTLLERVLNSTGEDMFHRRIVVTRSKEVQKICEQQDVEVIFHTLPNRNDTVHLGICAMEEMDGCLFCPADQPLLQKESIQRMINSFKLKNRGIKRLFYNEKQGAPILFGKEYFSELSNLPLKCGGSYLVKKYFKEVELVSASDAIELYDIDTYEDYEWLVKKYGK